MVKKGIGNTLILIVVGAFILAGLLIANSINQSKISPKATPVPTPASQEPKTFKSNFMKFSIELPNGFYGKDESSRITINSSEGQVYVNRSGTQFSDLDSYLNNFDQRTSLKTVSDEKLTINNYESRIRIFRNADSSSNGEKIYFIYVDNFVYKISTIVESLYDDLDQIAKSFRYIP